MASPKVVFIDHPYFAVKNKDNNYRFYKGKDSSGKRIYKQCKDKTEYAKEVKNYLFGNKGFFTYSRDEEKANITLTEKNISLFDYMLGETKDISVMEANNMKREQMMLKSNGEYMTDAEAIKKNFMWSKYFDNSNINLMVLSFSKDYIDENIGIDNFHKELATKIMPMFLKKCGYIDPKKNLDWVVALHSAVERNNYHFHIGFIEKKPSYLTTKNEIRYKQRLNLNDAEINFIKRQSVLSIERQKIFTPALVKLNKDLEEYKKYFNYKDKSFTLNHFHNLDYEYKILRLGKLLNEVRKESKCIKYNSLPNNKLGKEIRYLTKQIKEELLKDKSIQLSKNDINRSINEINNIYLKIDKENNISNAGFENAFDSKLINDKLEKYDNYILNAIVNHSLYMYKRNLNSNSSISMNDLVNEAVLLHYQKEKKKHKDNLLKKVLNDYFRNDTYNHKNSINSAFMRIKYKQDQAVEQFYEMLSDEKNMYK